MDMDSAASEQQQTRDPSSRGQSNDVQSLASTSPEQQNSAAYASLSYQSQQQFPSFDVASSQQQYMYAMEQPGHFSVHMAFNSHHGFGTQHLQQYPNIYQEQQILFHGAPQVPPLSSYQQQVSAHSGYQQGFYNSLCQPGPYMHQVYGRSPQCLQAYPLRPDEFYSNHRFTPNLPHAQGVSYSVKSPQISRSHNPSTAASLHFSGSRDTSRPIPISSSGFAALSRPRGPPRKPRQSGHALWVGNIPSGTNILDLKDHFARDATDTIESVFLISKSNCAFVNYQTEAACASAVSRFHDVNFRGVRLVCRLRRNVSSTAIATPSEAESDVAVRKPSTGEGSRSTGNETKARSITEAHDNAARAKNPMYEFHGKLQDRYFILKSLTVEDIEMSVRSGIWATQLHNEGVLNTAFESAENVYLLFSANKSGEYFGYGRMMSPINDEVASSVKWEPRTDRISNDPDLPCTIPTSPTETAPRGRIVDDSTRGTIFWEADLPEQNRDSKEQEDEHCNGEVVGNAQSFGRPFKIQWISTNRLPFYRIRGLRNPWNSNREVKIARDGTELDPLVGQRLIQMIYHATPAIYNV